MKYVYYVNLLDIKCANDSYLSCDSYYLADLDASRFFLYKIRHDRIKCLGFIWQLCCPVSKCTLIYQLHIPVVEVKALCRSFSEVFLQCGYLSLLPLPQMAVLS